MKSRPTIIFLDENHYTSSVMEIIFRLTPFLIEAGYDVYLAEMPADETLSSAIDDAAIVMSSVDMCIKALMTSKENVKKQIQSLVVTNSESALREILFQILKEMVNQVRLLNVDKIEDSDYILKRFVRITKSYAVICFMYLCSTNDPKIRVDVNQLFDIVYHDLISAINRYKSTLQSSFNFYELCAAGLLRYVPIDHTDSVKRILKTLEDVPANCARVIEETRQAREIHMADAHIKQADSAMNHAAFACHGASHVTGLQNEILKKMTQDSAERNFHFIFIQSYAADSLRFKTNPNLQHSRDMITNARIPVTVVDSSNQTVDSVVQQIQQAIESHGKRIYQPLHDMPLALFAHEKSPAAVNCEELSASVTARSVATKQTSF